MIASVIFGRAGSKGLPGKNTMLLFSKKVMEYPLIACKNSKYIDKMYVSTDSDEIANVAKQYNCLYIKRPDSLCNDTALLQDAITHAYQYIKQHNDNLKYLVITMCNAPNITSEAIDKGVEMLNTNSLLDSVITVSKYDMFSPERARTVDENGFLKPYVPFVAFNENVSCDRKSHKSTFFADGGMTIVRVECLEDISKNLLPFQWMGNNIGYIEQTPGGGDIDYPWQIESLKWWLTENGIVK
jgi:CMP-N-acetylneuraminic acid synthetase